MDTPYTPDAAPRLVLSLEEDLAARPNPLGLPEDLRAALLSLRRALLGHRRDWARQSGDAWIAGILVGWDCLDWPHDDPGELCPRNDTSKSLADRHAWGPGTVERLRAYQRAFAAALGELPDKRQEAPGPVFPTVRDAAEHLAQAAESSPRYRGEDGVQRLLDWPETAEHAFRVAQGQPGLTPEGLAMLALARKVVKEGRPQ